MSFYRPSGGSGSGGGGGDTYHGGAVVIADAATQADVSLGSGAAPSTVDGVTVTTGMIILVKDQVAQEENGPYSVIDAGTGVDDGTWARLSWMSTAAEIANLALVKVRQGAVSGLKEYIPTSLPPYVIGVSPITFALYPTSSGGGGVSVWDFGAGGVGTSTTERFLSPGSSPDMAGTLPTGWTAPADGTVDRLYLTHGVPAPSVGAGDITYTVYVGGVATALVVTLASDDAQAVNLVTSAGVTAGDEVWVAVDKGSSITTSPLIVEATMRFTPT